MSTLYKGLYRATNGEATNEFGQQFMQANVDYVANRLERWQADGQTFDGTITLRPSGVGVGLVYRRLNSGITNGGAEYHDENAAVVGFFGVNHGLGELRGNVIPSGWYHGFYTQNALRAQIDGLTSATQTPLLLSLNGTMRRVQVKAGNALTSGDLVAVLV